MLLFAMTSFGEAMRTCFALVDECGELGFELLGDFLLELGDFPGGIEDFREVNAEEEGGDLNLAGGGALELVEEGLRKRAGTFLFLFPKSKSVNKGSLLWSGFESLVLPPTTWTSLLCKLATCLLRVSTFAVEYSHWLHLMYSPSPTTST